MYAGGLGKLVKRYHAEFVKLHLQFIFRIGRNKAIDAHLLLPVRKFEVGDLRFTIQQADAHLLLQFPGLVFQYYVGGQQFQFGSGVPSELYQAVQVQLVDRIFVRQFYVEV